MDQAKTLDELIALRERLYLAASDAGMIGCIRTVARELGKEKYVHGDGLTYSFEWGDLKIWSRAKGGDFEVTLKGRSVACCIEGNKLFVPGWWETVIRDCYKDAVAASETRNKEAAEAERQDLIRQLWLDTPLPERQPTHN